MIQLLLMTLGYAVIVTILFLPFGVFGWLSTGDVGLLWLCCGFGAVFGGMLGAGQVIGGWLQNLLRSADDEDDKAEEADPSKETPQELGKSLLKFYLSPFLPSWLGIFDLTAAAAQAASTPARPGRGKRAIFGACFGLSMGLMLCGTAMLVLPAVPPAIEAIAMLCLGPALIGAVLGALSSGW